MKRTAATLAVFFCVSSLRAQSAGLTNAEVEDAIAAAKQPKYTSLFVEAHGRFAAYYTVLLQGPVGRTMDLAREQFENYKPLMVSDVRPEVKAHEITVVILKHGGNEEIRNVVVMPPGATSRDAAIQALQPRPFVSLNGVLRRDQRPRTWKSGLGQSTTSGPLLSYRFAEDSLPSGDLSIIVATNLGEERYTVKEQERSRIR